MSRKNKVKKKKTVGDHILTIVLIVAICIFCYAAFNLYHIYTEYKKGTDEYNSISEMAVTERDPDQVEEMNQPDEQPVAPVSVDFDSLRSINEDVIGWIYMEALPEISYPVVQGEDNNFYLHQTYEKNYNFAGTIFIDYENKRDFSDCNTLVYGHNMKNGSMFGMLKKYRADETLYNASKYFWILTPEKDYRYEIIAAYRNSSPLPEYAWATASPETWNFLQKCAKNRHHGHLTALVPLQERSCCGMKIILKKPEI